MLLLLTRPHIDNFTGVIYDIPDENDYKPLHYRLDSRYVYDALDNVYLLPFEYLNFDNAYHRWMYHSYPAYYGTYYVHYYPFYGGYDGFNNEYDREFGKFTGYTGHRKYYYGTSGKRYD
jgi:hypothetical protein